MQKKQKTMKKAQKIYTHFWGALERAGSSSTFFTPKKGFLKSSKSPIFIVFPEKMAGGHFFKKGLCWKEDTFRGSKTWKLFGVF